MKTLRILFYLLMFIIAAGQLTGSWLDYRWMEYTFKPLILLWVMVYYLVFHHKKTFSGLLLAAFFFSWIGDLVLMFAWKSDLYFFAGVGGFFVSQVLFIISFYTSIANPARGILSKRPWFILPFLIYLVTMSILIMPGLTGVMIPVVILYAISLVMMSMAAFNRLGQVPIVSFVLVFIGSVFFVVSDSLLAFNKFLDPLPHGAFIVMSTYILAQFFIVEGMVRR